MIVPPRPVYRKKRVMLTYYKLPLHFDPQRLRADLAQIAPDDWVSHFNTHIYEGDWSGVALRSVRGAALQLYPDPTAQGAFADTEILARCAYFQEVLAAFQCELESVRLLRLRAGSHIREHRDYRLALEDGVFRVHVPIETNPNVHFYLQNQRIEMHVGEAWYLNLNLPHRVENYSATDRVHLVVDGIVNDWVRAIIPAAVGEAA